MKKQFFLPILALVLGIAASAFTTVSNEQMAHFDPLWHFTGTTVQDQTDQDLYEPADEQPYLECNSDEVYCVIEAPEDLNRPGFPDLSNITSIVSMKDETE